MSPSGNKYLKIRIKTITAQMIFFGGDSDKCLSLSGSAPGFELGSVVMEFNTGRVR